MKDLEKIFSIIDEQFPNRGKRIRQLYETDELFQALCFDYVTCREALASHQRKYAEQGKTIDEYKGLIEHLEKELQEIIGGVEKIN